MDSPCCEPKHEREPGPIYKSTKYSDWEVEDMARSIMSAEEIKQDPEKLKLAKMCIDKKADAAKSAKLSLDEMSKKGADMDGEEPYEGEYKKKK
jgi:hypothetical protein